MRHTLLETLLIAAGCLIVIFSMLLDLFFDGTPGIGFEQFAGIVIGSIIILVGLRYLLLPNQAKWDWWIFGIYLCGILFMGLRPSATYDVHQIVLFGMNSISKRDLVINIAGFIPLGFIAMSAILNMNGRNKTIIYITIIAFSGLAISIVIETLQYLWVTGRYSSIYDLFTNTTGTVIGAVAYLAYHSRLFISHKT